jgi:signal transduction histidine kinase
VLTDLGELLRVHPLTNRNKLIILPMREDVVTEINGTELIQLLLNLTINALQCTPDAHEVEIQGHRLTENLELNLFPDGHETFFLNRPEFRNQAPLLAVSVRDNGPGISPESLSRIFDTGFTTKPVGQGTGLGLSIVHRFIKQCQGGLYVQTKLGQGTTFTVYLPARG